MMGRSHALTGIAAGIGATYAITLSVPAAIAGTAVCTGAALLPDIDHPNSTVSHTFGPVTQAFCWIMNHLTGGHRRGTHSIAGIAALGAIAEFGVLYRHAARPALYVPAQIALCVIIILTFAGAIRLLKIPGWIDDFAPVPIVIALVCLTDVPLEIIPPALMLGAAIHILGDVVTRQGCPIFWPLDQKNYRLNLFTTNGKVERLIVVPLVIITIVAELVWKVFAATH